MAGMTHPAYRRSVPYTMLWVVLVATLVGSFVTLWLTGRNDADLRVAGTFLGVGLAGSLIVLGRMTIEVDATTLRWGFGWLPWPRWQLPLADIAAVERATAPKSGSGIRTGPGGVRVYNTVIGGPALRLTLRDGRTLMLGTDEPDRLAGFIERRR